MTRQAWLTPLDRLVCHICGETIVVTETEKFRVLKCSCRLMSIQKDAVCKITATMVSDAESR